MKILAVSNLFPNALEPNRGVFNRQQFKALAALGELQVVAPVPWAPPGLRRLRHSWERASRIPAEGTVDGIRTWYPRHVVTPQVGRAWYAWWLFLSLRPAIERIRREFPFEVLLATWAYPDVVAASWVARALRVPLVAKVHGSDLHVYTRAFWRRRMIAAALTRAAGVVAVSSELKDQVVRLGVDPANVHVIPNGVDTAQFTPMDPVTCRTRLGLPERVRRVVFIGNLVPVKGLDTLLDAFAALPDDVALSIVGEGPLREALTSSVEAKRLSGRVTLVGARPHREMPLWLNAADVVCLPSRNEGCPNVVIEALACGRPVVGTRVGGIPELLHRAECGVLVTPNDARTLADGLRRSLMTPWEPRRIREAVAHHGWEATAQQLAGVLAAARNGHPTGGRVP